MVIGTLAITSPLRDILIYPSDMEESLDKDIVKKIFFIRESMEILYRVDYQNQIKQKLPPWKQD
jgi:hypothetical protein